MKKTAADAEMIFCTRMLPKLSSLRKKEGDPYVKNRFWKSYTEITDF